jgi:hypothetical protein
MFKRLLIEAKVIELLLLQVEQMSEAAGKPLFVLKKKMQTNCMRSGIFCFLTYQSRFLYTCWPAR